MEDRVKRALKTFEEHFSKIDELTHMVLKGHLIVEEAVNKNIEGGFPNSQYITALTSASQNRDVARHGREGNSYP